MDKQFSLIYRKNYQKLYTLAFRMTGNIEESEDILQTSFLNAYKGFSSFEGKSSPSTWLYKIVLNTSKKYYKESRKLPVVEYSEANNLTQAETYSYINQFGEIEDQYLTALTRENCLQMFMNCMPSKYRAVYTLRIVLGCTTKETAKILGLKDSTVKVNLHRAKKISKSLFDGRCSLIKPGSLCNCSNYARHLVELKKTDALIHIKFIQQNQQKASEEFTGEMEKISEELQIDNMYNTFIDPIEYDIFIKKIKQLVADKKIKILNYYSDSKN